MRPEPAIHLRFRQAKQVVKKGLEAELDNPHLDAAGAGRARKHGFRIARMGAGLDVNIAPSLPKEDIMRHVDFSPLYRSTVGFDRLFSLLDNRGIADQTPSYPPYNIERTGDNTYRITMAVAGFDEKELSLEAHAHVLTVKGEKAEAATAGESEYLYAKNSMLLTHRWLDRCVDHLKTTQPLYGYDQNLFPIVQGNKYPDLRKTSCEYIASKNAPGNAIGGLSVGEPEEVMYEITALCCEHLPQDKPRYLMGVGTPWNILECISLGIDMFDCVMPTRNGRNGMLFTTQGVINIRNKKWATDFSPIDAGLPNGISHYYTKAYLRHLFVSNELLGLTLASLQNLCFYLWLVSEARKKIKEGNFASWKNIMKEQFKQRL